jgi:hypothetical protein
MANPFTVQPLGGIQNIQGINQGMQGIAQRMQQERQQEQMAAAQQAVAQAFQSGDVNAIRQAMIQHPEMAEQAKNAFGFTNEQTERVARETYRRVLSDPENAPAYMQQGIQQVAEFGGRPDMMTRDFQMLQENPKAALQNIRSGYASLASDEEFRAMFGGQDGPNIGQYNPRDYTTESFAEFVRSGDPSVLERYAAQRSVDIGGVPHVFDPAIGGYRPAGVAGAGGAQPVTAETVGESEAEIAAQRESAVTRARGEAEAQTPEAQRKRQEAVRQSQDTLNVVNQLLDSDLGAITGLASRVPTVRPESMDLVRTAERLEALLTSENLGIMTGVLTDRDVELIKSIGSGLRVTEGGIQMSEEGARERLMQIRDTIQRKLAQQQSGAAPAPASNASQGSDIEALINKYAD